jgi:hypothetical protein
MAIGCRIRINSCFGEIFMSAEDNERIVALAYAKMRREQIRKELSPIFVPRFDILCETLEDTFWGPYAGKRSFALQGEYYSRGRTAPGPVITNAQPGDGPHNWACATDWCEWRPEFVAQEKWNKANWPQFADAVRGAGLIWGGDFKSIKDLPHCELGIAVSWRLVGDTFRKSGHGVALKFIQEQADKYTGGLTK